MVKGMTQDTQNFLVTLYGLFYRKN
jgi:hypothetical protein